MPILKFLKRYWRVDARNFISSYLRTSKITVCIIVLSIFFAESGYTTDWSVKNGWAYKNGSKFFAVGIWGFPGYNQTDPDRELFEEAAEYFNIVYSQPGFQKPYMYQDTTTSLFSGWTKLHYRFRDNGYVGDTSKFKNDDRIVDYGEIMTIRENLDYFNEYIEEKVALEIYQQTVARGADLIWFIADEPNTGFKGWYWHPDILELYYKATKKIHPNSIAFVDLFGHISGDRYHYELAYLRHHQQMPAELPEGMRHWAPYFEGDTDMMVTYNYAHDGTSVYRYTEGKWKAKRPEEMRDKYWQNVMESAEAYKNTADVFGVNTYKEFYFFPEVAGESVDAIKAGAGLETAVWLFFDATSHAKFSSMSHEEYYRTVKCQVYVSVIHGASGALFWSHPEGNRQAWNLTKELASELQSNSDIFKGEIIGSYLRGDVQHAIFESDSGKRHLIAVNCHKSERRMLRLPGISDRTMAPLQVSILELDN